LKLEDVFCSKTRMKILKLLFRFGQLNTSETANRIGADYKTALKNLQLLEKEGLVQHRLSGRIRYFRFTTSIRARATRELLEAWESDA
jgi:predicted transcriptional regulator